ncbi:hypothetical protein Q765_12945 [Flavobacterium rivuli WB 3.3-2 = DSM 21788]|uniref:Uncharacterized protein n=1 Tax=Flavobacterium rivuli WB 3.3-2 = DSM 21788 TaxID=1121895 RepID=A0A0A2M3B9_9FLAO|nr:hypothetical protein [Flavobacterium rivuli]KGO85968.1 hypothetical protein Q765_12945 [Flavobacterium rivuli WB 3.3-2 = DSM 21788]
MKKLTLIVIYSFIAMCFLNCELRSQEIGVPFRVGKKFGVSDFNGKMLIPAKYDKIVPNTYNGYNYMCAFILNENPILSSLIYNNKVIIDNQTYNDYYLKGGLVQATQYTVLKNYNYAVKGDHTQLVHLYDLNGKKVLKGDFKAIDICDDIDEPRKINVSLIYAYDLNDKLSLYLYDKSLNSILKTFIDAGKPVSINFNYHQNYKDRTITHVYADKNGVGKKIILKLSDNTIVAEPETIVDIPAEKKKEDEREDYGSLSINMPNNSKPLPPLNSKDEKKITTVRKIDIKRDLYYHPEKQKK